LPSAGFFACIIALGTHLYLDSRISVITKNSFFFLKKIKLIVKLNDAEQKIVLRMKIKSKHFKLSMKWHPLVNLFNFDFDTVSKSVSPEYESSNTCISLFSVYTKCGKVFWTLDWKHALQSLHIVAFWPAQYQLKLNKLSVFMATRSYTSPEYNRSWLNKFPKVVWVLIYSLIISYFY